MSPELPEALRVALRVIDVLATLSQTANFSIGCYCADPDRCHRTVLSDLFFERLATIG